ncbi:MAG: hypothetical protein M3Y08_16620, partial [Fibrobacterota bacterium]|nr:hypothetical protein [Fibrobacterota bacterium]
MHQSVGLMHPRPAGSLHSSAAYRLIIFASAIGLLAACASAPKTQSGDPSLPEIDVLQLKENSDEALKLAQENKLDLQSLETKVRELESRMSSLGDELANLPVAKLDELTQQMTLMTEQLRSLEDRLAKGGSGIGVKKDLSTFSPTALDTSGAKKYPVKGDSAGIKPAAGTKASPAPKTAPRKAPASEAEAQLYKKAFDLYYGRDYGKA